MTVNLSVHPILYQAFVLMTIVKMMISQKPAEAFIVTAGVVIDGLVFYIGMNVN